MNAKRLAEFRLYKVISGRANEDHNTLSILRYDGNCYGAGSREAISLRPRCTSSGKKFKTAVIKRDKAAVANLSQFPIGMPYLQKDIKTRADLSKRYRVVFNQETDAAKCFSKARPEIDSTRPKEFYVACSYPDGGGERPLVYYFTLTRTGWRFSAFDNINE